MINMILCGGIGARLWPLSRTHYPKQFCKIIDNKSLLQHTAIRNAPFCKGFQIVTNINQYFMAKDQLEDSGFNKLQFVLEPVGRNTAPAVALGVLNMEEDDMVLVTPSDHLILNQKAYEEMLVEAQKLAMEGNIVVFGIKPSNPETGYGYIQADGQEVVSFKEKPDSKTAQAYVADGSYFWNSGMLMFKASVFLEELAKFRPDVLEASREANEHADRENYIRIQHERMMRIPSVSFDYAILENTKRIKMVSADINWSDLGSFESLAEALDKDEDGNVRIGSAGLINIDSGNNLIISDAKKIACIDVEDLMIIDTRDAILIGKKSSSQKVKRVVEQLEAENSTLKDFHLTEYRPWGRYTVLDVGPRYKLKTICVNPGAQLSLQSHFHRSEHWVVVSGTARVTCGEKVFLVSSNEGTYIPSGEVHRLENPGKMDLIMIEAQVGDYLEEDDIVRYEDNYKRC